VKRMPREILKDALRIVVIYAIFAASWILVSDSVVTFLFQTPQQIQIVSTVKGWLFVLVTSLILLHLIQRLLKREYASIDAHQKDQRLIAELLDNSSDVIYAKDADGKYILANREVLSFFQKKASEVLGHDDMSLFSQDQAEMLRANDLKVMSENKSISYEEPLQHPGREVIYSSIKGPLHDAAGNVIGMFGISRDVTNNKLMEQALKESHERLQLLVSYAPVALALFDTNMRYLAASRRWMEDYKLKQQDIVGCLHYEVFPEISEEFKAIHRRALAGEVISNPSGKFVRFDGSVQWLRWEVRPWNHVDGSIGGIVIFSEDITKQKEAEIQMQVTAHVFDQAGEAIMIAGPDKIIQNVNAAFCRISGYTVAEVIGSPTSLLKSGRHTQEFYQKMWHEISANGFWQGEIWNRRKNGDVFPEWLTITRVSDDLGQVVHYVGVFSDISQIKNSQDKVEFLATHDVLTGLPNRALFNDRLEHALGAMRRNKSRLALLFIDLDNFKTINDTLGHDIGDGLLQQVAVRLREAVRDVDTLARLGGDEFTAIINDCTTDAVNDIASRIMAHLADLFVIQEHSIVVSASIGIAFYPEDGGDVTTLIRSADAAMYRAKELGRNRVEYFVPDLHVRLMKRAMIEHAMREALRQSRLRLVYQPKIAIKNQNLLVGAEALLRWRDPELGDVSPSEFIPIAESSSLIIEIGHIVQMLLVEQISQWLSQGFSVPTIAFNISPRAIREVLFSQQLIAELDARNVPHGNIQIEITEGALLESSEAVVANLDALAKVGIRVAVDDFGTGYSSLSYLKRLPLTELKIDKSFVDGLGSDKEDEAIARAVLALANALELKTVAEGVETDGQLAWLTHEGCDIVQGFYFYRPLEAEDFAALLEA
jgi:two-component system CheB/CheR fusion protein